MPNPSPPPSPDAAGSALGHTGFPVVGIGGSAGAFPALLELFAGLPESAGMAFVVVLHLSPDHDSDAAAILQRATAMPVIQVRRRTRLEPDQVYVIPPGLDLLTEDGHVQPTSRKRPRSPSSAIDIFFRTLADVHQERAIAIVLSGTGSDGAVGVTRIKEQGGITIAQDPNDAQFPEMPRSAIATDTIDFVLSIKEVAGRLVELSHTARNSRQAPVSVPPAKEDEERRQVADNALGDILSLLRVHTRNDFRNYKRATVLRRVARRMQIHGLSRLQKAPGTF